MDSEMIRSYYRDSPVEDLDDLYWRFFRRPWSEVFRASEMPGG